MDNKPTQPQELLEMIAKAKEDGDLGDNETLEILTLALQITKEDPMIGTVGVQDADVIINGSKSTDDSFGLRVEVIDTIGRTPVKFVASQKKLIEEGLAARKKAVDIVAAALTKAVEIGLKAAILGAI